MLPMAFVEMQDQQNLGRSFIQSLSPQLLQKLALFS